MLAIARAGDSGHHHRHDGILMVPVPLQMHILDVEAARMFPKLQEYPGSEVTTTNTQAMQSSAKQMVPHKSLCRREVAES